MNVENNIVKKSNDLVFTGCDLSLIQMKIVAIVVSSIFKDDDKLKDFKMQAKDFIDTLGIGGENYTYIKEVLRDFGSHPIEYYKDAKNWSISFWFTDASCKDGVINIKVNPSLAPHLLKLSERFTAYPLAYILDMKSKHNIKLFEIFKSALGGQNKYIFSMSLKEFKKLLNLDKNMEFKNIKQSILEKIDLPGIKVEYKTVKETRKVVGLTFSLYKTRLKKERKNDEKANSYRV